MSMTNGSVMMRSCPAQAGELRFEQSPDLLVAEIARAQTFDRRGEDRLSGAERVRGRMPGSCSPCRRAPVSMACLICSINWR
jgi:hypothetical protein